MIQQTLKLISTDDKQQIAVWQIEMDNTNTNNNNNNNDIDDTHKQNLLFIHGAFSDKNVCLGISSYFAKLGHRCFIMEWRGHGSSSQPDRNYNLEDIAFFDIKATFEYLSNEFGIKNLHCVTHSGGGICLTLFLTRFTKYVDSIKSISMFACQVFSGATTPLSYTKLLVGKAISRQIGVIRGQRLKLGTMNESYYLLSQWMDWNLNQNFKSYHPTPITKQVIKPVQRFITKPLTTQLQLPFYSKNFYKKRAQPTQPRNSAQVTDYRYLMPKITTPIYSVCAAGDFIATPKGCLTYLQAFKNSKNQFREFAVANGDLEDYNHTRIFLSQNAATEVWPTVLAWVKKHS